MAMLKNEGAINSNNCNYSKADLVSYNMVRTSNDEPPNRVIQTCSLLSVSENKAQQSCHDPHMPTELLNIHKPNGRKSCARPLGSYTEY